MKVKELLERLSGLDPEMDVLFEDGDSNSGPWAVQDVEVSVSEGQYPEDFNMPEGYTFVLLGDY